MPSTPFEKSLTLNATSQMLELTKPPYDSTAAVAPSSRLENALGYDVELPFLKSVYLQFKRPYILNYRHSPFSFHTDHPGQLQTLRELADVIPRTVFYSLPLVETDSDLDETLEKTLFIKVECLKADTSRIRIYRDYSRRGEWQVDTVRAKVRNGDWYDLSDNCWLSWRHFESGLTSRASGIESWIEDEHDNMDWEPVGIVVKEQGEPAIYPDSQVSVRDKVEARISEKGLSFDEEGLTAGLFGRA